jgi:homoserine kinase type II
LLADADRKGALDPGRVEAMVAAYTAIRPVTAEERSMWAPLLRAGALRFWLSRLYDLHRPRPGEITSAHDPVDFESILRERIASPPRLPA